MTCKNKAVQHQVKNIVEVLKSFSKFSGSHKELAVALFDKMEEIKIEEEFDVHGAFNDLYDVFEDVYLI